MIIETIILIISLILLIKGSDFFVKSSASIAKRFGISEFVIGLTLVALGTSIPELASSIMASLKNASGLVIGNIVGANIANIGLVVGIAAIISVIKTRKEILERDGYLLLFITALLFLFVLNGKISRAEGVVLILLYVAYIVFLFETKPKFKKKYQWNEFIKYFFKFQYFTTIKSKIISGINNKKLSSYQKKEVKELFRLVLWKDFMILILGAGAVILGAKYLIREALFFADFFKVPQTIIGVLIAIGTTMPEMSVAITAARKGYGNIVIGNAIGSCIANTLLILGTAVLIFPLNILKLTIYYAVPFMILMVVLLLVFIKSHWEIRRIEGIIFIILYLIFITFLVFSL